MNLKALRHVDKEDLLNALGLEAKPSTTLWLAGVLGTFGVGLLVGAGLGLLLAPKTGQELRGDLRNRFRRTCDDVSDLAPKPHPERTSVG